MQRLDAYIQLFYILDSWPTLVLCLHSAAGPDIAMKG